MRILNRALVLLLIISVEIAAHTLFPHHSRYKALLLL